MRKLLFIILISTVLFSSAQIQKFSFEGSKIYPEGNQISYFNVKGIKDKTEAFFIQKKFLKNEEVIRFHIYEGSPINRCMMESSRELDEEYIYNQLKSYQENYRNIKKNNPKEYSKLLRDLYDIQDFPYYKSTGNKQKDDASFATEYANWKNNNPEKNKIIQHIRFELIGVIPRTNNHSHKTRSHE